jgi:hypothetical protein
MGRDGRDVWEGNFGKGKVSWGEGDECGGKEDIGGKGRRGLFMGIPVRQIAGRTDGKFVSDRN